MAARRSAARKLSRCSRFIFPRSSPARSSVTKISPPPCRAHSPESNSPKSPPEPNASRSAFSKKSSSPTTSRSRSPSTKKIFPTSPRPKPGYFSRRSRPAFYSISAATPTSPSVFPKCSGSVCRKISITPTRPPACVISGRAGTFH